MLSVDRIPARVIGGAAVAVMVLGTAAGAHAATDKKHKPVLHKRVQTITYQGGCGITAGVQATPGTCVLGGSYNLAFKRGEKYVSISVKDSIAPGVPAVLWLGTGVNAANQQFCTSIKNFQPGGTTPQLDLFDGVDPTCPGSATQGTITVTYSNLPIK